MYKKEPATSAAKLHSILPYDSRSCTNGQIDRADEGPKRAYILFLFKPHDIVLAAPPNVITLVLQLLQQEWFIRSKHMVHRSMASSMGVPACHNDFGQFVRFHGAMPSCNRAAASAG
jgi:hypothetical protein